MEIKIEKSSLWLYPRTWMSSIWDILNISTLKYLVSLRSQISRLFSAIKVWGKISDNTALVTSEISEELTETNGSQKTILKKEATPPPQKKNKKQNWRHLLDWLELGPFCLAFACSHCSSPITWFIIYLNKWK